MKIKINLFAMVFMSLVLCGIAFGQGDRIQQGGPANLQEKKGMPTLGCCRCLDGGNTLDLSTVKDNPWMLNGKPVVYLAPKHPSWSKAFGNAAWVSANAKWETSYPAGEYTYTLNFNVPNCAIDQEIRLVGDAGGDNRFDVYLGSTKISTCAGSDCFKAGKAVPSFSVPVYPGNNQKLTVVVYNEGGPSGMIIGARLESKCSTSLIKEKK